MKSFKEFSQVVEGKETSEQEGIITVIQDFKV